MTSPSALSAQYAQILKGLQPGSMMYQIFQNAVQNPTSVNPAALQQDLQPGNAPGPYDAMPGYYGANGVTDYQPTPAAPAFPSPAAPIAPVQPPASAGTPPIGQPDIPYQPNPGNGLQPIGPTVGESMRPGLMNMPIRGINTPADAAAAGRAAPNDAGGISLPGGTQLPISLGGLNFGNLNLGGILPMLFGTGLGLWNMLGSKGAYTNAGNIVNTAEQAAGNEVNNTAQAGASGVTGAASTGNGILDQLLHYFNGQTAPYQSAGGAAAGTIESGLTPGGALNPRAMTGQDILNANPGYQFQLGEGERQIQGSNAARGLSGSGPEEKQLLQYSQGLAQQAENNAFQQQQTGMQNLFQRLYGTAGIGETGVGQGITSGEAFGAPQASNLLNAATTAGGLNLAGSQYKGNAEATGAGAQAGGIIDANQAQQTFIQQLMAMIPMLFGQGGGGSGLGGVGTGGLSLSDLLGPYLNQQGYATA